MRMWMVNPELMCDKHLLGEHCEIHMFVGSIKKGKRIDGFVKNNLLEIQSIQSRHKELVGEMERRGYKHRSDLPELRNSDFEYLPKELIEAKIDKGKALGELLRRCKACRERYENTKPRNCH